MTFYLPAEQLPGVWRKLYDILKECSVTDLRVRIWHAGLACLASPFADLAIAAQWCTLERANEITRLRVKLCKTFYLQCIRSYHYR